MLSTEDCMAMLMRHRGYARGIALAASPNIVLEVLPLAEASALSALGITSVDFVDAFDSVEDTTSAVGSCAVAVWTLLNEARLKGAPSCIQANPSRPPHGSGLTIASALLNSNQFQPRATLFNREFSRREIGLPSIKKRRCKNEASTDSMQELNSLHSIYCLIGSHGRKWMDAPTDMVERRKSIFILSRAR